MRHVLRVTDKVIDVKYTPVYDSSRRHINIPLSKALPTILHQDMVIPIEKRMRESEEYYEEVEVKVDTRNREITGAPCQQQSSQD